VEETAATEVVSDLTTLQLKNMPMTRVTVKLIPGTDLDAILKEDQIPLAKGCKLERNGDDATFTIERAEENRAWQIILTKQAPRLGPTSMQTSQPRCQRRCEVRCPARWKHHHVGQTIRIRTIMRKAYHS
jgi:hypothetical protein